MKELKKSVKVIIIVAVVLVCVLSVVFGLVFGLKNNSNTPPAPPPSNPNNPIDPPGPGGEDPEPPDDTKPMFNLYINYNLPESFKYAVEGLKVQDKGQKSSTYELSSLLANVNLGKYLQGWFYDVENGQEIANGIIGPIDESTDEVRVKAEWNETDLEKYYYSDGLQLDSQSGTGVSISKYEGTAEHVYLPAVFVDPTTQQELHVNEISEGAFKDNKSVKQLIIPDEIASLKMGNEAFANSSIETFDMAKVNVLGNAVFQNSALSSVTFQNSNLQEISQNTFNGCQNLTTVTVTSRIDRILNDAFAGCTSLEDISFLSSLGSATNLMNRVFSGCTGLQVIEIPKNVTMLGERVFENCSNISQVTLYERECFIKQSLQRFSNKFGDLSQSLKKVIFGSGVERIPNSFLDGYANLEEVVFDPNSVQSIEAYAFNNCTKLAAINLSELNNLTNFNISSIIDTKWYETSNDIIVANKVLIVVPNGVKHETTLDLSGYDITSIADEVFQGFDELQTIILPNSLKHIGASTFRFCAKLTTVQFASGDNGPAEVLLETIGNYAFTGCNKLAEVGFSSMSHLTSIGAFAFMDCSSLSSLDLSNTALTSIAQCAFQLNSDIVYDEVVLPNTITSLGSKVFLSMKIKAFSMEGSSDYLSVENGILYTKGTNRKTLYMYPIASEEVLFDVPEGVTNIADSAFSWSDNLKAIYFKAALADKLEINVHAFDNVSEIALLVEDTNYQFASNLHNDIYLKTELVSETDYTFAEDTITLTDDGKQKLDELSAYRSGWFVVVSDGSGTSKLFLVTKSGDEYNFELYIDNYVNE